MILKNQPLNINRDNPFEEDKLGRDKNIDSLTQLPANCTGSFVLAVDAPWASGKTTFIKMWEQSECGVFYPTMRTRMKNKPLPATIKHSLYSLLR
ncbi:MAG: hypothetical protein KAW12_12635 [Candidatus Aminicenantes bacterium]|nr:hypothetical protein [Candidatus Aminicenantes bacterium]